MRIPGKADQKIKMRQNRPYKHGYKYNILKKHDIVSVISIAPWSDFFFTLINLKLFEFSQKSSPFNV